jgi:hypothetical protein
MNDAISWLAGNFLWFGLAALAFFVLEIINFAVLARNMMRANVSRFGTGFVLHIVFGGCALVSALPFVVGFICWAVAALSK